jgi:hypothetical protein
MVLDIDENGWATVMFFFGIAFFLYAVLRLWENAKYYGIMCILFIILIILFGLVLENVIFVKMQLGKKLEDEIGWAFLISLVGVFVGIIGIFRFRK